MQTYDVTGMSCAACEAHVTKAVSKVPGVTNCTVSLLTNSMTIEGTASESAIEKAVEDAGYGAKLRGSKDKQAAVSASMKLAGEEEALRDKETPKMVKRLTASVIVLLILMYFSMGHMMWSFPVPALIDNPVSLAVLEMLLAIIVMFINRRFFISGTKGVIHGAPNMDTLVAMGSAASFGYSLAAMFLMIDAMAKGDSPQVEMLDRKSVV